MYTSGVVLFFCLVVAIGGESIYGPKFADEWDKGVIKHSEPGMQINGFKAVAFLALIHFLVLLPNRSIIHG